MKTLFCSRSMLRPKKACLRRVAQTVDGSNLIQKSRTCKRQCDRSSSKASQTLRTCKNHRPLCTRSFGSHTQEAPCILCHTKVHSRHNRYRTLAFGLQCRGPRAGVPMPESPCGVLACRTHHPIPGKVAPENRRFLRRPTWTIAVDLPKSYQVNLGLQEKTP